MSHRQQQGFTLIELIIAVAIIGALAGLAIPAYVGYLDKARLARCIAEIRYIERAIDAFEVANESLPNSLAEAGAGDLVDPWGNSYEYLNIAALTLPGGGGGGGAGGAGGGAAGGGGTGGAKKGAWLWLLPDEAYAAQTGGNGDTAKPRKDRFLHPINSDYDLYSMGKDGKTVEALTAKMSHDDVIRGNDGQFVGLAAEF
ncbi:MAG: prepilin-type N-terminal cleavage/methylation domain-containing protein [Nitrospira defluvii]|nr:prepilin-type N-terminal cleavage/methylation domain-containing protein [Nitrospira defluvii]